MPFQSWRISDIGGLLPKLLLSRPMAFIHLPFKFIILSKAQRLMASAGGLRRARLSGSLHLLRHHSAAGAILVPKIFAHQLTLTHHAPASIYPPFLHNPGSIENQPHSSMAIVCQALCSDNAFLCIAAGRSMKA